MKKCPKNLNTLYIYTDGHAVGVFSVYNAKSGRRLEHVEIWEEFCKNNNIAGRLIVNLRYGSEGLFGLLQSSERVTVRPEQTLKHVSDTSKLKDIKLGQVTVYTPFGPVNFDQIENYGGDFTVQEGDYSDTFNPHTTYWGHYRVDRIHSKKEKAENS
jgi:hypothetical protein